MARTEREIADRFEAYELADAGEKAAALVRWLQKTGWRVHPELADGVPPRPAKAHPDVQAARVAEARAAVEATRRALQAGGPS